MMLAAGVLLGASAAAQAAAVASGATGSCTWALNADSTLTISGSGAMADYAQGATPWNAYLTAIKTVVLADSATSVGSWAFGGGVNLAAVARPASVASLGERAFSGCSALKAMALPASVASIGSTAFISCPALPAISVEEANAAYASEEGVLYNKDKTTLIACPAGKSKANLAIPSTVTSIASSAFYYCSGLTGTLSLPAGLTTIGNNAFYYCDGLSTLSLPASLTSIGNYAFYYCSGLKSVIAFSPAPLAVEYYAFYPISAAVELVVPLNTYAAYADADGWKAFSKISEGGLCNGYLYKARPNHRALGSISATLSGSTLSLTATPASGQAFLGWTSGSTTLAATPTLTLSVAQDTTLTASFGTLARHHLAAAGTLKAVANIKAATRLVITGELDARDLQLVRDSIPMLIELDLSGAAIVAYAGLGGTYAYSTSYPANELPQFAFYNNTSFTSKTSLASVLLPQGLTAINYNAFYNCSGLTGTLSLPQGLTAIGNDAFYSCSSLTGTLCLPQGLTTIGNNAFSNCSGITGVSLPEGLTAIGAYTFYNCRALSAVVIPEKVGSIGAYAFYGCKALTSVGNLSLQPQVISAAANQLGNLNLSNATLRVPLVDRYLAADVWKDFGRIEGASLAALNAQVAALQADSATLQALLSACQSSKPTAIGATHPATLQAYPNPAGTELTVAGEGLAGGKVEVYTLAGTLARTYSVPAGASAEVSLDISTLPQGAYLIKVGSRVAKVAKK
jgi:hypothetical protein